jgi:ABC-type nitrate/sulfonate/bicarbonate transport system ATPase subunit
LNPFLEVKNITKYFKGEAGSRQLIFENLSFSINEEHNITSILAPFGGGKTTLLKILSGLDSDFMGEILLNGDKTKNKFPFIPEKPASFPWLNVKGNIRSIIDVLEKEERPSEIKLQELIDLTGLTSYEDHFPHNKSYGFRFRISLARALAVSPQIILLDDPFKPMDSETKDEIFELIKKIATIKRIKFILTTSNITEAALLSDKILLIKNKPVYLSGEIIIDKYKHRLEQLKDEIQEIVQKENMINASNFSI